MCECSFNLLSQYMQHAQSFRTSITVFHVTGFNPFPFNLQCWNMASQHATGSFDFCISIQLIADSIKLSWLPIFLQSFAAVSMISTCALHLVASLVTAAFCSAVCSGVQVGGHLELTHDWNCVTQKLFPWTLYNSQLGALRKHAKSCGL